MWPSHTSSSSRAGQSHAGASNACCRASSAGRLGARQQRRLLRAAQPRARRCCSSNAGARSPTPAEAHSSDQTALQQQSAILSQRRRTRQLPDAQLFSSIKACRTWLDCQQLLALNDHSLDAMLLSTLVTQTVAVTVSSPPAPRGSSSGSGVTASDAHQLQQQRGSASSSSSSSISKACSRARNASGISRYLRQLADAALHGASGFRPQQFSNVLWGLARCGYRPQAAWLMRYLEAAELRLVAFQPRNLAQLLWALGAMRSPPPARFAASWLAESSDRLADFQPIDLANALWACAVLSLQPPPDWTGAAACAAARQWARFKPCELSITVWALAKLGVQLAPQQQQQTALAVVLGAGGGGGLDGSGLAGLAAAAAQQLPVMAPQEAGNLLCGLATGRAQLPPQQLQWLAGAALQVLLQHPAGSCSQALCCVAWALVRLGWTPSGDQAGALLQLLLRQQQARDLSCRQAALLLWACGRLRLRLPPAAMQLLMGQLAQQLPAAAAADAVQVLAGCRALLWQPGRPWWRAFYTNSQDVLQSASAGELAQLLGAAVVLRTGQPAAAWWRLFWGAMQQRLDLLMQLRGLRRRRQLAKAVGGSSGSKAAAPLAPSSSSGGGGGGDSAVDAAGAAKAGGSAAGVRKQRHSSSSSSSTGRGRSTSGQAAAVPPAAATTWAERRRCMQNLVALQGAARPLPAQQQHVSWALLRPGQAAQLLWCCAALQRLPPKKVMWQLLLSVLVDVHAFTPGQLAAVLWALGRLLADRGRSSVQCHTLLRHLAVAAQWRLHVGLAGGAAEQRRLQRALRFMAHTAQVAQLLVPRCMPAPAGAGVAER